jgi:uncharacterized membrane protein
MVIFMKFGVLFIITQALRSVKMYTKQCSMCSEEKELDKIELDFFDKIIFAEKNYFNT